jgi:hypothetical protein
MEDTPACAVSPPDPEAHETPELTADRIPESEIGPQEHVPDIENLSEVMPITTTSPPPEIEVDEQLSGDFIEAELERPKMMPPFGTAGSLCSVVNCIRDGNQVLGALVAQLRDLNSSIRKNLNS